MNLKDSSVSDIEDDEIEKPVKVKRRKDGTFRKGVSGNKSGRPAGTKSKLSEARLTNILNKFGPLAAEEIMRLAQIEAAKGNSATAIKAYAVVFDKYVQSVHKQQAADLKEATTKLVEEEEEDSTSIQPVVFSATTGT